MAYVPNPADPTQPQGSVFAQTAAAEFRALKGYIANLISFAESWSPSNKHSSIELTNNNLTATKVVNDGIMANVLGLYAKSSGKWYWEVVVNSINGVPGYIGIIPGGVPNTVYPGQTLATYGYGVGGPQGKVSGAPVTATDFHFVPGDVIGVSLDCDNHVFQIRKNGSLYPFGQSTVSGIAAVPYYPVVATPNQNDQFTAIFDRQSMIYGPPSGYEAMYNSGIGFYNTVARRQCAQSGAIFSSNPNGTPNFLVVNGVNLDLNASAATPLVISGAFGFGLFGQKDVVAILSSAVASWFTGFANNTKYYLKASISVTAVTPVATNAPPWYAGAYPKNGQALLHFNGAAGSTTMIDAFGNTWTAQGGAKITANPKFGNGALGGGGGGDILNGTTDYVRSVDFNFIPDDNGWRIRAWVALQSNPGAGNFKTAVAFTGAGGFGIKLGVFNNAGTVRWAYCLSSNNAANDIAANVQGTSAPTLGVYTFLELVFDQLNGIYRLFINGAQEAFTNSAVKVHNLITLAGIGATPTGAEFLDGRIDEVDFCPWSEGVTGAVTVPVAEQDITAAGYAAQWFDINGYMMYSVASESAVAGVNPGFNVVTDVYLGEVDMGAGVINTLRLIPYQARVDFIGPAAIPAAGTRQAINHNIGFKRVKAELLFVCEVPDNNYEAGHTVKAALSGATTAGQFLALENRNTASFDYGTNIQVLNRTNGAVGVMTVANWGFSVSFERPW